MPINIIDFQNEFQQSDWETRHRILDALLEVFRPSDYRYFGKLLCPGRFVGDSIQILPFELVVMIFGYLEPRDIFLLRSVSTIWNVFLSQTSFMNEMDSIMFAPDLLNPVDSCNLKSLRSFEDRARCLCAIRNGTPYSFELISDPNNDPARAFYCSGILLLWLEPQILVKRLYTEDSEWSGLFGDEMEVFQEVEINMNHILALSFDGMVYCWNVTSLKQQAKFKIPPLTDVHLLSNSTTILLNDERRWYIYSLRNTSLSIQPVDWSMISSQPQVWKIFVDEDGLVSAIRLDDMLLIYRVDELGTSLSLVKEINLWSEVERTLVAAGQDRSLTQSARMKVIFGHECVWASEQDRWQGDKSEHSCIFELRTGSLKLQYHKVMQERLQQGKAIFYPMATRSFFSSSSKCKDELPVDTVLGEISKPGRSGTNSFGRMPLKPRLKPETVPSRDSHKIWKHTGIDLQGWPDLFDGHILGPDVLGDLHFLIVSDWTTGTVGVFRFYEDHMLANKTTCDLKAVNNSEPD